MNQILADVDETQTLEGNAVESLLSEKMVKHPFVLFAQKKGLTGLNDRLYMIAKAICDCSGHYCPIKEIIGFRSLQTSQRKPQLNITVIIKQNGEDVPLELSMNDSPNPDERNLMHGGEVVLYWWQIQILMQHHADFILVARDS